MWNRDLWNVMPCRLVHSWAAFPEHGLRMAFWLEQTDYMALWDRTAWAVKLNTTNCSWFQTFAVFWILCMFFWVFPRHRIVVCRCFGTFYRFHLQRLVVQCEVWIVRGNRIFIPVPGRVGASMYNQEEVQVVGGPEWIRTQRKTGQANYTH
jgi:hypothetical protein